MSASNVNTKQVILVPSNPTEPAASPEATGFIPLLTYGGVSVAIILAMAFFSESLLNAIARLLEIWNTKRK
jgi:hypothetical protein